MLESTVLDELVPGNVSVLPRQTHGEAERDFRVRGVQVCGAELDDVAEAFFFAVLAEDATVGVVDTKKPGCELVYLEGLRTWTSGLHTSRYNST